MASTVPRQVLSLVDEPSSGEAILAAGAVVALIDDRAGVAEALALLLEHAGISAEVVDDRPSVSCLNGIIDMSGLRPLANAAAASALACNAFLRAQACQSKLSNDQPAVYVAVFDNGGGHGLLPEASALSPWRAALGALAKGIRHEWPAAQVKSVDIATAGLTPQDVAQRLFAELTCGGPQIEVALPADGLRYVPRLNRSAPPQTPALEIDGLVVVSGGGRGVTARCVLTLAQYCQGPYLLLGRTPLQTEAPVTANCPDEESLRALLFRRAQGNGKRPTPSNIDRQVSAILANREIEQTLAVLHDHDITARYVAVDARDPVAVQTVIEAARADFGPVQALIHGAGLRIDRPLSDKTISQFEAVFGTKADAFNALLMATSADPLRLIALFGSVVGRSGQRGLIDYGMGCEVLNKLAWAEQRRRGEACRVVSINWGEWAEEDPRKTQPSGPGGHLLPPEEGAGLFVRETLSGADGSVEVMYGDGFVLP